MFMLASSYIDRKTRQPAHAVIGYWLSEKYDGQRVQWDPVRHQLLSRNGNVVNAPDWFLSPLKACPLAIDGELYLGRGNWDLTGLFRAKTPDSNMWQRVRFMMFDIADSKLGTYVQRRAILANWILVHWTTPAIPDMENSVKPEEEPVDMSVSSSEASSSASQDEASELDLIESGITVGPYYLIPIERVTSSKQVDERFKEIVAAGGEGLMLNAPQGLYTGSRSTAILKYKQVYDDQCLIVGYKPGNGKYTGLLGSFKVVPIEDGVPDYRREFGLSGMTDVVRRTYMTSHPLGTVLNYSYIELTKAGIPKNPVYLGICQRQVLAQSSARTAGVPVVKAQAMST